MEPGSTVFLDDAVVEADLSEEALGKLAHQGDRERIVVAVVLVLHDHGIRHVRLMRVTFVVLPVGVIHRARVSGPVNAPFGFVWLALM